MTRYYADGRPADCGGKAIRYDAGGRAHLVDRYGEVEVLKAERREVALGGDPEAIFRQALIDADSEPMENLEAAEAILDPLLKASQADVARQLAEARGEIGTLRMALAMIVGIAKTPMAGVDPLPIIIAQAGDALLKTGRAI